MLQVAFDRSLSLLSSELIAGMHHRDLTAIATRAVPYGLCVLGEVYMIELGQLDNAERFFKRAKAYDKKYDFQQVLGYRIKSNEETLAAKRAREEGE